MMTRSQIQQRVLPILLCAMAASAHAQSLGEVELESGYVWVGRADVRIPGDEGTRVSLTSDLDADETAYVRGRLTWHPAPRHAILLTLSPLQAEATGELPRDTRFVDTDFPAGEHVKATYRFNNYRLTYRYQVWNTERFRAHLGGTLFVRDAKVSLASATLRDSDSDLGLVPLVHFRLAFHLHPRMALVMDGDALAAPQGRAIDVLCALQYEVRDALNIGLGYRILEGGADNDNVYTFALFHHAAATLTWRF